MLADSEALPDAEPDADPDADPDALPLALSLALSEAEPLALPAAIAYGAPMLYIILIGTCAATAILVAVKWSAFPL
jgi:hypothetical protein